MEKNRPEEIVDLLKERILGGSLREGESLPKEDDLADEFAVSRACIRECLSVLKAQGYLLSRRGKAGGTFVADLLYNDARNSLYWELYLLGKMRASDVLDQHLLLFPEIVKIVAEKRIQIAGNNFDIFEIYQDIAKVCPNPVYTLSFNSITYFIERLFQQKRMEGDLGKYASILGDMVHAIGVGDGRFAVEKAYVHVSVLKSDILSFL